MVPGAPLPLLAVSGFPGAALQTREALLVRCRRPGPTSRGALGWVCAGLGGHRRGLSDVRPGLGLSGAKAQRRPPFLSHRNMGLQHRGTVCVAPRWPGGRYSSRLCRPLGRWWSSCPVFSSLEGIGRPADRVLGGGLGWKAGWHRQAPWCWPPPLHPLLPSGPMRVARVPLTNP